MLGLCVLYSRLGKTAVNIFEFNHSILLLVTGFTAQEQLTIAQD